MAFNIGRSHLSNDRMYHCIRTASNDVTQYIRAESPTNAHRRQESTSHIGVKVKKIISNAIAPDPPIFNQPSYKAVLTAINV